MLEKRIYGEWNLDSVLEKNEEIRWDFNHQGISIRTANEEGFVPDWRIHKRASSKSENVLEGYEILKKKNQYFIFFDTKSEYFRDTFLIETLTEKELVLTNQNKRINAFKGIPPTR